MCLFILICFCFGFLPSTTSHLTPPPPPPTYSTISYFLHHPWPLAIVHFTNLSPPPSSLHFPPLFIHSHHQFISHLQASITTSKLQQATHSSPANHKRSCKFPIHHGKYPLHPCLSNPQSPSQAPMASIVLRRTTQSPISIQSPAISLTISQAYLQNMQIQNYNSIPAQIHQGHNFLIIFSFLSRTSLI